MTILDTLAASRSELLAHLLDATHPVLGDDDDDDDWSKWSNWSNWNPLWGKHDTDPVVPWPGRA
ncbi:hypothetical protein [Dactylosporangium sp. CS-033363]|uniref:hypothetical protein n=1 Tax=Dactylosporangium sp. CS-033363 TaxID=3239935 RepID=UPI003D8EBBB0